MSLPPTLPPAAYQLYWSRPSLTYLKALNRIGLEFASHNEPVLAIVSSSFYAVEAIKRTPNAITLVGTGVFDPDLFTDHMIPWAWGEVSPAKLVKLTKPFSVIFWAEPQVSSVESTLQQLEAVAQRGCSLNILISQRVERTGREIYISRPGLESLSPGKVLKYLGRTGWIVDAILPFEGLRARFWRKIAGSFQRMGWLAWSDRCTLTMNNQIRDPGWLWRLATLVLIHAQKA